MPPKDENWNQHKWYKTYDEERRQWDIRFEDPKWGNFLAACTHKEIAQYIIDLHNSSIRPDVLEYYGYDEDQIARAQGIA